MCVYFVRRESEILPSSLGLQLVFHTAMLSSKGQHVVFLLVGTVWQQKLLSDKNGNFLQFEQEASVQYESFFLAFQWM